MTDVCSCRRLYETNVCFTLHIYYTCLLPGRTSSLACFELCDRTHDAMQSNSPKNNHSLSCTGEQLIFKPKGESLRYPFQMDRLPILWRIHTWFNIPVGTVPCLVCHK